MKRYGICNIVGCVAICGILCGAIATIGGYETAAATENEKEEKVDFSALVKKNIDNAKKNPDSKELCEKIIANKKLGESALRTVITSLPSKGIDERFLASLLAFITKGELKVGGAKIEVRDPDGKLVTPAENKKFFSIDFDGSIITIKQNLQKAAKRVLAAINADNQAKKNQGKDVMIEASGIIKEFNDSFKCAVDAIIDDEMDGEKLIVTINTNVEKLKKMCANAKTKTTKVEGGSQKVQAELLGKAELLPKALEMLIGLIHDKGNKLGELKKNAVEICELRKLNADKTKTIDEQKKRIHQLMTEIGALEKAKDEALEKVQELSEKNANNGNAIDELKKEIDKLKEDIAKKDKEIGELKKKIKELEEAAQNKERALGNATADIEALTRRMDECFKIMETLIDAVNDGLKESGGGEDNINISLEEQLGKSPYASIDEYEEYRKENGFTHKELKDITTKETLELEHGLTRYRSAGTAAKEKSLKEEKKKGKSKDRKPAPVADSETDA
ncbi:hypothetical protein FACS1894122_12540 [Alphaproteobacteria bacterium]|nr:hypothetical protein FACS1894122_12540 [Alphaproteobacteria bacterium]